MYQILDRFELSDDCLKFDNYICIRRKLFRKLLKYIHGIRISARFVFIKHYVCSRILFWKPKQKKLENIALDVQHTDNKRKVNQKPLMLTHQ